MPKRKERMPVPTTKPTVRRFANDKADGSESTQKSAGSTKNAICSDILTKHWQRTAAKSADGEPITRNSTAKGQRYTTKRTN